MTESTFSPVTKYNIAHTNVRFHKVMVLVVKCFHTFSAFNDGNKISARDPYLFTPNASLKLKGFKTQFGAPYYEAIRLVYGDPRSSDYVFGPYNSVNTAFKRQSTSNS